MSDGKIILIGGPTASGKSALAMQIARQNNGCIINADAMQIYAGLPLLTAQPDPQDKAETPHFLYEVTDAAEASSAGKWLTQAQACIAEVQAMGRTPIVVGGTGMYFQALLGGLLDIPDIPADVRAEAEQLYAQWGEEKFRAALAERDPASAARIARNDRQRLVRAYEVVVHSGRTLAEWHRDSQYQPETPPLTPPARGGEYHRSSRTVVSLTSTVKSPTCNGSGLVPLPLREGLGVGFQVKYGVGLEKYEKYLLMPPRDELYAACDNRFVAMIERGAIDEVKNLMRRDLSPALPAMKILGVREIAAYLRGEIDLKTATQKAQQATRNYAKRQMTWFRNQWK